MKVANLAIALALAGTCDALALQPNRDGLAVYRSICQGCHMADAKGAQGAGTYPALAGNAKLGAASYPVFVVLNGRKGMPPFKRYLSDEEVADVVNYVRTNFGNNYGDRVTVDDVKKMRSPQ
jgi:mono/diheme cytochrome c family protein